MNGTRRIQSPSEKHKTKIKQMEQQSEMTVATINQILNVFGQLLN